MKTTYPFFIAVIFVMSCSSPQVEELGVEWKSIERDLQSQLITAGDSAVIELPAGHYMFTRSLSVDGNKHLIIRGQGVDKTILSFQNQEEGAEGLKIANGVSILIENFTIENAKGDNIKVTDTDGITFRNIKSQWTGTPKETNGAYAFYPVLCKNVLVENCIAIGSSDAGIYVGQSDSVIVRNNEAYYNVAGIESENSRWVEIYNNYAHDNTGGILVFDMPGLTQTGHTTRVFNNKMVSNNYRNFAPEGNVVATVPPGTGLMLLATRNIEIFGNEMINNKTVGVAIASYKIVEAMSSGEETQLDQNIEMSKVDESYDPYPTDIFVHNNTYQNKHWFPTLKNDFGLLFLVKFPFSTPDIVWDGIKNEQGEFSLCVKESIASFANLDAANDFENLNQEVDPFICEGNQIEPIL
ncbi:parallel beta-helix domain-containing protein [Marinoscillum pacificum]|uniref:parallel beta-helix domain-containing protein n=1 Tax=Marinoscillum pacificum TaxID=392723 RepID=UPI002157A028|nr:parallel beta-helix domain-containing protein [Marinoscillum pacificum]